MTQKKSALTFCASALSHLAILCFRMSLLCEMPPMPLLQKLFLHACLCGWSCRSSSFLRSRCCPDTFLLRNKGALKLGSCPCQDLFQLSNPHTLYLVCLVSRTVFQPSKNKAPWLLLSACQARLSAPATSYCTHGFAAACKFCARSCNPYMPQAFPRTCGGIACGGQHQHLPRWASCHRRVCQWALQPLSRQYHYIDEWDFPFHSLWRQIILSCGFHLFYLNGIIWAAVVTFLYIFGESYARWRHLKGFNDVTLFIFNRPESILPSSFYYLNICM